MQTARDLLLDLMRFHSISGEELAISAFLYDILRDMGLPVKREFVSRGTFNVIVNDTPSPLLVVTSHLDTVKIQSLPRASSNCVSGTGSVDDKASIVSMLIALKSLGDIPEGISFAFFADEEDKGSGSEKYLIQHKPKYALVMEPTELKVCFEGYGALEGVLFIEGKRMHPAVAFTQSDANAIFKSLNIIQKLKQSLEDKGFLFTVYAMNCGSEAEYATPEVCNLWFNIGASPSAKIHKAFRVLSQLAAELEFNFMIKEYANGFVTNDDAIRNVVTNAYREVFKRDIITDVMMSWTDANNFALHGSQPIIFGPGSLKVAHSPSEQVLVDEIVLAALFLISLVSRIEKAT